MAATASDILIETIMDWGVDVVFGLPGDGINGIMEALRIRQDKVRFIHVRHEESAAFMACGETGFTIDDPANCGSALDEALRAPGPVVIEALARGTPYRGRIITTVLSDKVRELI